MSRLNTVVVLVSCVKSKQPHACLAKDLYSSTLFNAQRLFAEKIGDRWFILSAKYGLLNPDDPIEPYEKTLNGAPVVEKKVWSKGVFDKIRNEVSLPATLIVTAGESYCRFLVPQLVEFGYRVERPLKGLTMGFQPGRLRELAKHGREALIKELSSA